MAKINNSTEVFEYFNNNPEYKPMKNGKPRKWNHGDCAIRAVAVATGMSWEDAYDFMSASAKKVHDCLNTNIGFAQIMKDLGFTRHTFGRLSKGSSRPTVEEFAADHKNEVCILAPANHYVCAKNGKFYDTWNSGDCKVYSWWTKE